MAVAGSVVKEGGSEKREGVAVRDFLKIYVKQRKNIKSLLNSESKKK